MNSLSILFFAAMLSTSNASATDAQALAQSKGCLSCHAVNSQLVGPAYKAVAKLYAGKPDAENHLVQKLVKGGSGVWGQMPMPGGLVNEKEARVLAKWVLSIK